jgi:16S rRNA (uracil1498-N3)-methyltransferase
MSEPRFFVSGIHHPNEIVSIEGDDAHHISNVLRLRAGDRIEIIDSGARAFVAELSGNRKKLRVRLLEEKSRLPARRRRVDVAQAMPKSSKMDSIVEKSTELGVTAVLPFCSERTIVRSVGEAKLQRWRRIARGAAEQCGRRDVPAVPEPVSFGALIARFCAYDVVLFAWEGAIGEPLRQRLPQLLSHADSVLVVVGPEGGFSHAEADAARRSGAEIVSLGERVLRTETAAPALLAILDYETG